jgi:hypothetical protein
MIIQCSGALGDEAIEAPDLGNLVSLVSLHCLTLVRYVRTVKPKVGRGALLEPAMLGS